MFVTPRVLQSLIYLRYQHTTHPHIQATQYSLKTSTGVLRKHLYECHADAWITGCDQKKIPITAKEAQLAVAEYRQRHGQQSSGTSEQSKNTRPFSQQAFLDAIVEFIVGDDQVRSFNGYPYNYSNLFLSSLSMSSKVRSSVQYS